jgi:hypothetical protein
MTKLAKWRKNGGDDRNGRSQYIFRAGPFRADVWYDAGWTVKLHGEEIASGQPDLPGDSFDGMYEAAMVEAEEWIRGYVERMHKATSEVLAALPPPSNRGER